MHTTGDRDQIAMHDIKQTIHLVFVPGWNFWSNKGVFSMLMRCLVAGNETDHQKDQSIIRGLEF